MSSADTPMMPKPWDLKVFEIDVPLDCFIEFAPLVLLWKSRVEGGPLPSWSSFTPHDLLPWLGWIAVEDFTNPPVELKCRLWGTQLTELYGYDLTGRRLSQDMQRRGILDEDLSFYEELFDHRRIGLAAGSISWQGREHVSIHRIFLPCASDGLAVDTLLSCAKPATLS
jgi:hypothetical protein